MNEVKEALPNNEERVAIDMPRLHGVFPILKHNLDVFSKIRTHDRGLKVGISPSGSGGNAVEIENSRDLEVVSQFQWSVCLNK